LAFINIGQKSLWWDEACSVLFASSSWKELWRIISTDEANQGLYYIILKLWISFGQDEVTLRSLSAIFGIFLVPLIYVIGSHLFNNRSGLCSALIISTNAFFLEYSQEARAYTMLLFFITLSSFFFIKSIEQPTWKNRTAYVVFSILAVYTHFFAALVLLAHVLSLVSLKFRKMQWSGIFTTYFTIGLFLSPLAIFMLTADTVHVTWITKPAIKDVYRFFMEITGSNGRALLFLHFSACFIFAIFAVQSYLQNGKSIQTWKYFSLISWLFLPVFVTYIYSIYKTPIFLPKYLIVTLPSLVLMTGNAISRIKNRYVFSIVVLIFVALSIHSVFMKTYPKPKENFKDATSFVISQAQIGDAIIFCARDARVPFDYYRKRMGAPPDVLNCIYPSPYGVEYWGKRKQIPELTPQLLRSLGGNYERLWLVLAHDYIPQDGIDSRPILESLNFDFQIQIYKEFTAVRVILFNRTKLFTSDL